MIRRSRSRPTRINRPPPAPATGAPARTTRDRCPRAGARGSSARSRPASCWTDSTLPDRDVRRVHAAVQPDVKTRSPLRTFTSGCTASSRSRSLPARPLATAGCVVALESHAHAGLRVGEQEHRRASPRRLHDATDETVAGDHRHARSRSPSSVPLSSATVDSKLPGEPATTCAVTPGMSAAYGRVRRARRSSRFSRCAPRGPRPPRHGASRQVAAQHPVLLLQVGTRASPRRTSRRPATGRRRPRDWTGAMESRAASRTVRVTPLPLPRASSVINVIDVRTRRMSTERRRLVRRYTATAQELLAVSAPLRGHEHLLERVELLEALARADHHASTAGSGR